MATITIATFNVENLLRRFNFYSFGRLTKEPVLELLGVAGGTEEGMQLRKALHVVTTDDARQITAQAIRETKADVVCVQEIENKEILDAFNNYYLKEATGVHYGWRRSFDGNDRRGIDVGVMSKIRISVKSHAEHTFDDFGLFNDKLREYGLSEGDRIFRRDCLEVNLKVGNKPLSLFVCHFKSMVGGRDETRCVREAEAKAVCRIIKDKLEKEKTDPAKADWLILGDMNDYTHVNGVPDNKHSLGAFFKNNFAYDLLAKLKPARDRWTHYWAGQDQLRQLDHIFASPSLAKKNPKPTAKCVRAGMPYRVPGLEKVARFPRVGFDRPKASDHCPVVVTLKV